MVQARGENSKIHFILKHDLKSNFSVILVGDIVLLSMASSNVPKLFCCFSCLKMDIKSMAVLCVVMKHGKDTDN